MCTTMYTLKPILQNTIIDYPTCMYKMKPLIDIDNTKDEGLGVSHMKSTTNLVDKHINDQIQAILKKKLPIMASLEIRQQNILKQLEELRQQIQLMNKDLNLCSKPAQPANVKISNESTQTGGNVIKLKPINLKYLQDIVINVNPKHVPYSLLELKKLWSKRLNLDIQNFIHSTISDISEDAQNFIDIIKKNSNDNPELPTLKLCLTWKNIGVNSELISSSFMYVPVYGEVNILRYLSRIGPSEFNYETNENVNEIDQLLDMCYQLSNENVLKSRQNYLRLFGSKLGKLRYFAGDVISLADVAIYSTLKQIGSNNLLPNLSKWIQIGF